MSTLDWSAVYRRKKDIVAREIAGETVLVPIRGNLTELQNIYVTNTVGAFIWEQIDGARDLEAVAGALLDEYDAELATIKPDMEEFLSKTLEAGVVEKVE